MTDHYTKAQNLVTWAEREGGTWEEDHAYAAMAQVHATLALAEQQRVANLIALGDDCLYNDEGRMHADIARALRIGVIHD